MVITDYGALLLELSEYRKFRHLTRHIYQVELRAERVVTLAQNVPAIFNQIKLAAATFRYGWKVFV